MSKTYAPNWTQLVQAAAIFDGRSCAAEGDSPDSIVGVDDGKQGERMDQNGTFFDLNDCCLVAKCLWHRGDPESALPPACRDVKVECPSRWGRYDPQTCRAEVPVASADDPDVYEDAHRQGFFHSQKECCERHCMLDGCQSTSDRTDWHHACCPCVQDLTADQVRQSEEDNLHV